jgi:hypothetical protein
MPLQPVPDPLAKNHKPHAARGEARLPVGLAPEGKRSPRHSVSERAAAPDRFNAKRCVVGFSAGA